MRILMINSVCGIRSTGRICTDLAKEFEAQGYEVKIAYGRETVPEKFQKYAVRIGTEFEVGIHALLTRIFDCHGFASKKATKRFLQWAEKYNPDVLWLHNIHGYYINVELLFDWIKSRPNMEVKWTLHDCWAFTGHCVYFTAVQCEQWRTQCVSCNESRRYPTSWCKDNCKANFSKKKSLFTGIKNMTIITPSQWLANLVKLSFLKEYSVEVHYNKIDTNIFKPSASDFRKRYGLQNKKMILGIASVWDERKGLNEFLELSQMLDDTYSIVLVGLSKRQMARLPKRIIGIKQTNCLQELVAIYSSADVFVNPSKEETFGMTTIEAIACGTSVIVYKNTACEEVVGKFGGGIAIHPGAKSIYQAIINEQYIKDNK